MAELALERLRSGELPLWNPHACAGIPLLATLQVGVFYPPSWLGLALPAGSAIPLRAFAEVVAGGWLLALFLRSTGRGELAAALGGIVFAFSCLLGQTFWPPQVSTLVWIPWQLLCVERWVRTGAARWWAALACGVALQLLAGFPQLGLYGASLVGPYALLRLLEELRAGRRRPARALGAALLAGLAAMLGAGLASVQVLPTLELVSQSSRSTPLSPADQLYLGTPLSAGEFLRNALDPAPKSIAFGYSSGAGYVGLATLPLLALGVLAGRRHPTTWLWVVAGGLGLLLSTGPSGRDGELASPFPIGGFFRTHERLQLLPLFAASVLGASGLDALSRGFGLRWERRAALAVGLGVAACAAAFGAAGSLARALACAALIAVAARGGGGRAAALAPALLLALLVGDLALATGPHGSLRRLPVGWARSLHARGQEVLPPAAIGRLGGEQGLDRVAAFGTLPFAGSGALGHLRRVECYEPLAPRSWSELTRTAGVRADYGAAATLDPERFPAFYDIASAQRFVRATRQSSRAPTDERALRRRLRARMREPGPAPGPPEGLVVEIAENPDALPRAYFVEDFAVEASGRALERVVHGDFDFRRQVLLERWPDGLAGAGDPAPARAARIASDAPERVVVEVAAPRAGLLVLADTFYPGWRARVDGRPADLLRGNALFRAVPLPAGSHRVAFEYAPASLRVGAALSLGSLALLALVLLRTSGRSAVPARPRSAPRVARQGPPG